MTTLPDAFAIALEHHQAGSALLAQGQFDEAIACFRRAIQSKPDLREAHSHLAAALHAQGNLGSAVESYRAALKLKPDDAVLCNSLGNALWILGKLNEAYICYRQAIALRPDYTEAYTNVGNALLFQGKLEEAADNCRRALELNPNYVVAHNNLGNVLLSQAKPDEAATWYRQAIALNPDYAEAHCNLAGALQQLGRFDEALGSYARALELRPDDAYAHYGRANLKLLHGDFEGGLAEYQWRLKTNEHVQRKFAQPMWDGAPLANRAVLLHAEQGLGDTIQFVRYAKLIKQQNSDATVIVECQPPLSKLLAHCPGIDRLAPRGDALPPFDLQAPMMSLPGILKTTLQTIPADIPYLFAEPELVEHWREKLAGVSGVRIGIHWRGRSKSDRRVIPLRCFADLSDVPGVRLISLQKGASELSADEKAGSSIVSLGDDFDTVRGAFVDTAAIMMNLDLVISCDTSVVHLAGALGVPVWLVAAFVPDWRWQLERSDSPWYPTMRIFRQKSPGDWSSAFQAMNAALLHKFGH